MAFFTPKKRYEYERTGSAQTMGKYHVQGKINSIYQFNTGLKRYLVHNVVSNNGDYFLIGSHV